MKKLFYFLRKLFDNSQAEDQLDDELRFHLQMSMEKKMEAGMNENEARKEALRDFGGVEQVKEETREGWGIRIVQEMARDVLYALRQMRKHKVFTIVTLLTLTICLGANTAVFSLIHSILLRPYNFSESNRVVNIGLQSRKSGSGNAVHNISPKSFLDIKETAQSYEAIGFCVLGGKADLRVSNKILRIEYNQVTPEMWDVTGVKPVVGRLFTQEDIEKGNTDQVILSYQSWKKFYNKSPTAIGSTITLDNKTHTITGILPKDFRFQLNTSALWLPKVFNSWDRSEKSRGNNSFLIFALLKPDASLLQAQHELETIYAAYLDQHPEKRENAERRGHNYGVVLSKDHLPSQVPIVRIMLWSMQGGVIIILLVGILNISSLILVRSYHRLSELSMRHFLGASKQRIIRQLTIETLLLFLIAGLLSLPFAQSILTILDNVMTASSTTLDFQNRFNPSVIGTLFVLLLCFGAFCGTFSAWSVLKNKSQLSLFSRDRNSTTSKHVHWLQNIFVTSQISLSIILLVATGVLLKNVNNLLEKEFGYATENRLFAKIFLPEYRYNDIKSKIDPFRHQVLERLKNLPGITQVAFSERHPLDTSSMNQSSFKIEGYEPGPMDPSFHGTHYRVSPDYFKTMQIKLLQGRGFTEMDTTENERVVIVSQSVAKDYKHEGELLEKTLIFWEKDYKIVGIVKDTKDFPFFVKEPRHTVYFSSTQWGRRYNGSVNFVIHTNLNLTVQKETIRKTILEVDPELSEITLTTMKNIVQSGLVAQRTPALVIACVAIVAIALSLLGLYGVLSYSVSERQREFGIRMALGESPYGISTLILWWGGRLTLIGLSLGITGAYFAMRLTNNLLPDVNTTALDTFLLASLLVIFTTLLAVAIPARRAALTDPMKALRTE